jgi:hypothetical protein
VAIITDRSVAISEMKMELRSALVNSDVRNTVR